MSKLLVIAEHNGQRLNPSTARALACGSQLGIGAADVVVLGHAVAGIAAEAAAISGVGRVLVADQTEFARPLAAVFAPALAELARGYTHVLAPSTTFGKDLLPRIAALLGVPQVSEVMAVEGPRTFRRPTYAGNAIVTVEVPEGLPVVATVRNASFKAASAGGPAPVEAWQPAVAAPSHTRYVELRAGGGDRPDLQTARLVVSGGRGVGSAENFTILYRLADKLGAAVGASRAAVDAGFVPNELQVGQTGKIIAPEVYFAFGISGAIQHLTGIKDAGTIIAVNKDGDAPIFEIADVGLVGDLFQIIPEIERRLG
jgi:electron transfer flavoprotein alpha subunit